MQEYDPRGRPETYGSFTRWLHWLMAVVLLWQFASAITHQLAEDSPLDEFLWASHKSVGALLMALIVIRILWSLATARQRPAPVSGLARLGHWAMYALLLAIPSLALVRQYGSGREFSPFGLPLISGFDGDKIEWMTDLGSNFHSLLAWILLVLIVGHIAAAAWHWLTGRKDIFHRMAENKAH